MASVPSEPETPRSASIRAQLLWLVLAVALPLIALAAWNLNATFQAQRQHVHDDVFHLAQIAASDTAKFLVQTQNILNGFAARPAVRALDPARCDPLLKDFLGLAPRFNNVITADAGGTLVCSAVPVPGVRQPNEEERQRLRGIKGFSVGKPILSPLTGRWVLPVSAPLRDAQGGFIGSVTLGIDLLRFPVLPSAEGMTAGTAVSLLASDGTVLADSRPGGKFVGTNQSGHALYREVMRIRHGNSEQFGVDGIARVQGFTPVAGTDWIAVASVPASALYTVLHARAATSILIGIAVLGAALLLALRLGRQIRDPIAALAGAAGEVAAGNLAVRAPVAGGAEIAEVAAQFNHMLDARAAVETELRASEQRYRLAASTGDVWDMNIALGTSTMPARFKQVLGYADAEIEDTAAALEALMHPEDRGRWKQVLADHLRRRAPYALEFRARSKSGGFRWFTTRGQAVWDEAGRATYMAGTTFDITERKQADEKIAEQLSELQRWYQATLGREDRVGELKREVNELRARLGEPARYGDPKAGAADAE